MRFLSILFLSLLSIPAWAIDLSGNFIQGGYVYGQVEKGQNIYLNDSKINTDKEGYFIIGFNREYPETATLTVKNKRGEIAETKQLKIKQRDYNIERIDGLPPSKVTPRTEEQQAQINKEWTIKQDAYKDIQSGNGFTQKFIKPVEGRFSGFYGSQRVLNGEPRRPHFGLDIAAPKGTNPMDYIGTPIKSPADGIVTLAREDMYFEGNMVFIDHGQGLVSIMMHLEDINVEKGEHVKQGDIIGTLGMTGRATGPHLHWGLRLNGGIHLDPQLMIEDNQSYAYNE